MNEEKAIAAAAAASTAPRRSGRRRFWPRVRARTRLVLRRILTLLGPFVAVALLLWVVGLIFGSRVSYELMILSAASFLWFGTTVIFTPILGVEVGSGVRGLELPIVDTTISIHLGVWDIGLWVMVLNTAAAFLYAYNLDLLEKLPWIGPFLRRARRNAGATLDQHPWIRRLAEAGIVLFVVSPLPGSGQLGGCFIGRVIGLPKRTTFLVVSLAGVGVAAFYALFAEYLADVLDNAEVGPWVRIGGFVVVLVLAWLIFKLLKWLGRKDEAGSEGGGEAA